MRRSIATKPGWMRSKVESWRATTWPPAARQQSRGPGPGRRFELLWVLWTPAIGGSSRHWDGEKLNDFRPRSLARFWL